MKGHTRGLVRLLAAFLGLGVAADAGAQALVADAGEDLVIECADGEATPVNLDGTGSTTGAGVEYLWSAPGVSFDDETSLTPIGLFPPGVTFVELEVTAPGSPAVSDTVKVTVVDTTPPTVSARAVPETLWPPNHKLVPVDVIVRVRDRCDGTPTVVLLGVDSDEPDNGQGDGNTTNDIQQVDEGTDDRSFLLRAERQGPGDGRVYTALYRITDGAGNSSRAVARVVVPHDQGGGDDHGGGGGLDEGLLACETAREVVQDWTSRLPSPDLFDPLPVCLRACREWDKGCAAMANAASRCVQSEVRALASLGRLLCSSQEWRERRAHCAALQAETAGPDSEHVRRDLALALERCESQAEGCQDDCRRLLD
jgi:hypothetical protein